MTPKVTIEITPDGWTRTVNLGNKTYIEKWVRIPTGAKSIAGNFEDEKGIDDDLYEALNTTSELDISLALRSFVEKKKGVC